MACSPLRSNLPHLARQTCVLAGVIVTGASRHSWEGDEPGGRRPLPGIATALLLVHVEPTAGGGHSLRAPFLLGVHCGVVPDESGVSAVQAAGLAAGDRVLVPVRVTAVPRRVIAGCSTAVFEAVFF